VSEQQRAEYYIEPLASRHDRAAFSCGIVALDTYIQKQASQDQERKLAATFVLTSDSGNIAGFYSLSASNILAEDLPPDQAKRLPRFPLPVTLLGRMAMQEALHGQRLGEFLLMDALKRAWVGSHQIASWAVIVDAKQGARDFYIKYGFIPTTRSPDRLFYPMKSVEKAFHLS
jgi:predicted GNAT family N-acyltransferase